MKVKLGTSIEKHLVEQLQATARREGRQLNEILEEALQRYFVSAATDDVVQRTWGNCRVDRGTLRRLMDEDLYES